VNKESPSLLADLSVMYYRHRRLFCLTDDRLDPKIDGILKLPLPVWSLLSIQE